MTRLEIVTEAARRLGDTSPAYLTEVDKAFDFVLGDLAAHEAIGQLRQLANLTIDTDTRSYATDADLGLASGVFPFEILSLRVWAWGPEGLIKRSRDDTEFEELRATEGEDIRGKFRLWRLWPNESALQVHPPASAEQDGDTCEVLFIAPPTVIASGAQITEVHFEDLETIVYGLQARGAMMKEETGGDLQTAEALYVAGRQRMWGRRKNRRIRQIRAEDLP